LTQTTPAQDFAAFYWLKEELVAFFRVQGLAATGSKPELTARIYQFLETGKTSPAVSQPPAARTDMPRTFIRASVAGSGWRCSQELRAFLHKKGPAHKVSGLLFRLKF
jgi:hypothetical protein